MTRSWRAKRTRHSGGPLSGNTWMHATRQRSGMTRNGLLSAFALVAMLVVAPIALAQTTSSSSSSSSSSSGSSSSLDRSDVLSAVALGAGARRVWIDRSIVDDLFDDPIMVGDDACVHGARVVRGGLVASNVRITDAMRLDLARAILLSNGTPTADALATVFQGDRFKLVPSDCDVGTSIRSALFGQCALRGRGCDVALFTRIVLDTDGLDIAEKARILASIRR